MLVFGLLCIPFIIWSSALYTYIAEPLIKNLPQGGMLIATQVVTPFTGPLKLSLYATLILMIPFILYQVWAFIAPGLYPREKRIVRPLLFTSTTLFYAGMAFAHWVILPLALGFFVQVAPKNVTIMTDIAHYLDFILALYFAFGLAFQVPILTFLLCHSGITSVEALKKQRPYVIVGAFIVGMLLTPPDVISQVLLAIPLLILFEGGLLLAQWYSSRPLREQM